MVKKVQRVCFACLLHVAMQLATLHPTNLNKKLEHLWKLKFRRRETLQSVRKQINNNNVRRTINPPDYFARNLNYISWPKYSTVHWVQYYSRKMDCDSRSRVEPIFCGSFGSSFHFDPESRVEASAESVFGFCKTRSRPINARFCMSKSHSPRLWIFPLQLHDL